MQNYIKIFKALSEEIRLRIMRVLIKAPDGLCVCEIVDALQESQYNISRHLNILKNSGLVIDKRDGVWIYYSVNKNVDKFYKHFLNLISLISEEKNDDMKRLRKRLSIRKNGKCIIGFKR